MKIEINQKIRFKLASIGGMIDEVEGEGIVKKKGLIFYEVRCEGYTVLVKPSETLNCL